MLPLIGGIIILGIVVFIIWICLAPIFSKIGAFVNKKLKPFKNEEEIEIKNEQV